MAAQSQRPLVNKILALDPLTTSRGIFHSVDEALAAMPLAELAEALSAHDIEVPVRTLTRWRSDVIYEALR